MYIHKNPREDRFNAIKEVGGVFNGKNWRVTLDQAVQLAQGSEWRFYVARNGQSSWVYVATGPSGRLHLKTEADTTTVDNLLSLPEFPVLFPV